MEMPKFEQYLEKQFAKGYFGLDDEMSDEYEKWVCNLDIQEVIDFAEAWGQELYENTNSKNSI